MSISLLWAYDFSGDDDLGAAIAAIALRRPSRGYARVSKRIAVCGAEY